MSVEEGGVWCRVCGTSLLGGGRCDHVPAAGPAVVGTGEEEVVVVAPEVQDWKAGTFSLSLPEVAVALGVSPESVVDLMLCGELGFWVPPSPAGRRGVALESVRFDPMDVDAWRSGRAASGGRAASAVLENLRVYLEQCPPVVGYDQAIREGLPLSVRGRVYVRPEALVDFARRAGAPAGAQMLDTTTRALVSVGAERRRGLRPEGETRQRWAYWLLLPVSSPAASGSLDGFLTARPPAPVPGVVPVPALPEDEAWGEWEETR